ncbi:hypothetical protein E2562_006503 [Oryza meyeriana var. granulata]|uniref:Uncharacterized protein n=1 Tax=Oryza meyeriana var. granulata TaxID=110450 RepID=A0A6G1CQF9_9ORYZ|nr:hypothetical protein E2562_006503 [Oryza meyeriana var. granulata]
MANNGDGYGGGHGSWSSSLPYNAEATYYNAFAGSTVATWEARRKNVPADSTAPFSGGDPWRGFDSNAFDMKLFDDKDDSIYFHVMFTGETRGHNNGSRYFFAEIVGEDKPAKWRTGDGVAGAPGD